MPQSRPPRHSSPGSPDRRALAQAFQDVVRTEQGKQPKRPEPRLGSGRRGARPVLFLVAVGLLLTLLTQPRWLFRRPPEEPPALQEASLRVRMYVEIDRVERFRTESGRLPQTLLEAGADTSGLTYTPGEGGYTLRGVNNGLTLTYRSDMAPREFLGESYRLITQRGKP
jgi:hypothetical protein